MKKNAFLFLAFLLIAGMSIAQTQRIALRSHSGSLSALTPGSDGNFGLPYYPPPQYRKKDCNNTIDSTGILRPDTTRVRNPQTSEVKNPDLGSAARFASRTH